MSDCPIRYRRPLRLAGLVGGYKIVSGGGWFAICPTCGARIESGLTHAGGHTIGWTSRLETRKQAKDALHRHAVREHKLGQEGRREASGTHGRA